MGRSLSLLIAAACALALAGCGRKSKSKAAAASGGAGDLSGLGARAGSADEVRLGTVYGLTENVYAPSGVRPDPDLFVRRMLRQFRAEGSTIAQEIGRVENYRLLLGGASEDFRTTPQEGYDATSLLALQTVAEEVCRGLVNPTGWEHPGWNTILPSPPAEIDANLHFLAKNILGVPASKVDETRLAPLRAMVNLAAVSGQITNASYIPACAALSLDAEALLL